MVALKLLPVLAVLVAILGVDYAFGGLEMGDGIIETSELAITPGGGFTNGEIIRITQQGATMATGTFTNNFGEIQTSELTLLTAEGGLASQAITFTQGSTTAQGFFNDNGNGVVEIFEITITEQGVLFENGLITIKGSFGFIIATANFLDSDDDVINNGDLNITNGGSGFSTGTVVLSGAVSSASTVAQFTDTIIQDSDGDGVEDSIDNCIFISNPGQENNYGTSAGDACEDTDGDSVNDDTDNCPINSNADQKNLDLDGLGNACDSLNEINQSMIIASDHSLIGDLIIDNTSVLTLSNDSTISIPQGSKLLVKEFSGFKIIAGSSFTIV